eukprot:UN34337
MGWCESLRGYCVYNTIKTVQVQDFRLSCIYYSLTFLILVYILLFSMIKNRGYLMFDDPVGSIRLLLHHYNHNTHPNSLPYCNDYRKTDNITCVVMDQHDVRYPDTDTLQLLATTYIEESHQVRNKKCTGGFCNPNEIYFEENLYKYFVPSIEDYTLEVNVAAKSSLFCARKQLCSFSGTSGTSTGTMTYFDENDELQTIKIASINNGRFTYETNFRSGLN